MTVKSLPDEVLGKATLRIVMGAGVYRGTVIRDGKSGDVHEDTDLERLRHRLREEAGKSDPAYWGYAGAIERFRKFFPGGFKDDAFLGSERSYKQKAAIALSEILPLERALDASQHDAAAATKIVGMTNLLAHQHEQQQMRELLASAAGGEFVKATAELVLGDGAAAFQKLTSLSRKVGRISWPIATYFPFLWRPKEHMFLKPEVTKDYATRVGHDFTLRYEPDLGLDVYASLLDLVSQTEKHLRPLQPADRIDVQSFMWVVGKYGSEELNKLQGTPVDQTS